MLCVNAMATGNPKSNRHLIWAISCPACEGDTLALLRADTKQLFCPNCMAIFQVEKVVLTSQGYAERVAR